MSNRSFRLALAQMRVEGGQRKRNIDRAVNRIAEASAGGAKVVVLPECLDLGWTHASSQHSAGIIPGGAAYEALARSATEHRIHVCAGLTEAVEGQVFNSAVFIDPQGKLVGLHRKLNELEIGHEFYAQGDRLNVVHTEWGTFGLMVCADGFAVGQVLGRSLGYMGAQVILSPSAWAVPADHDPDREPYGALWRESYGPVARDFSLYIVGVSCVGAIEGGPWSGRRCIGCSLGVGPDGEPFLEGPYGVDADCLLYADIEPLARPARGDGWAVWQEGRQER